MQRFELRDPLRNHDKFWEVSAPVGLRRTTRNWLVVCHWGRIGTAGQERDFFFDTFAEAEKFRGKKINEKIDKGYAFAGATLEAPEARAPEPHTVSASTEREDTLPPIDPEDPFSLPFDD